ncbi:MAG: tRNA-intron lyase [Promethearchaeota archaeon]
MKNENNLNTKKITQNNMDSKIQNKTNITYKTIKVPEKIKAQLIETSIIIMNYNDGNFLYSGGKYFGKPLGIKKPKIGIYYKRPFELSFLEGFYLLKKGKIEIYNPKIGKNISLEELEIHASKYEQSFKDKYEIYEDLRDKGYIVRPGLKFGADFAVYREGPGIDHSPYIIQVLPKTAKLKAIDIVRAGRLANSVKKRFIIANALNKTYYAFKWYKP